VNEAVASERWLDSDAMRAHAVDFRWREELLSFESMFMKSSTSHVGRRASS
jgi:hypothetical protein